MFITRSSYKSSLTGLFSPDGEQMWDATEIALFQSWFLVTMDVREVDDDQFASASTVLLSNFRSVEPLLQSGQDSNIRLRSVHIVTPGHRNGSRDWKMEKIRSVWEGWEAVGDQTLPVDIFETVSGNKYPASFCHIAVEDLKGNTLKYQLPGDCADPS